MKVSEINLLTVPVIIWLCYILVDHKDEQNTDESFEFGNVLDEVHKAVNKNKPRKKSNQAAKNKGKKTNKRKNKSEDQISETFNTLNNIHSDLGALIKKNSKKRKPSKK